MRPREVVVYATKIDSRGRKVKTYPPDRHCEICDAPLSRYNPATDNHRCWLHRIRESVRVRGVA